MSCSEGEILSGHGASVYHPRQPQQSPLWKLLDTHYEIFERDYDQKFVKTYGYRRAVVEDVVRDYLKCGDLREGFARVRCPYCCHDVPHIGPTANVSVAQFSPVPKPLSKRTAA